MQKLITLVFLLGLILTSGANAASYQMINGTIVDPILDTNGAVLSYSGNNLEPSANLNGADLNGADLRFADLNNAFLIDAYLSGAYLSDAYLNNAFLNYADLIDANLRFAHLSDADLSGANLTGATELGTTHGSPYYNAETDFTSAWSGGFGSALFDPVAAGWTFVPEPSTALLLGIGLAGLGMRRRAH